MIQNLIFQYLEFHYFKVISWIELNEERVLLKRINAVIIRMKKPKPIECFPINCCPVYYQNKSFVLRWRTLWCRDVNWLVFFQIYTSGSNTFTETWTRSVKIDGSYIFDKGENMSEYFRATGFSSDVFLSSMKNYKIHACFKDSTFHTKEWCGGEIFENKMTLDVEGPVRYPDDKEGN